MARFHKHKATMITAAHRHTVMKAFSSIGVHYTAQLRVISPSPKTILFSGKKADKAKRGNGFAPKYSRAAVSPLLLIPDYLKSRDNAFSVHSALRTLIYAEEATILFPGPEVLLGDIGMVSVNLRRPPYRSPYSTGGSLTVRPLHLQYDPPPLPERKIATPVKERRRFSVTTCSFTASYEHIHTILMLGFSQVVQ